MKDNKNKIALWSGPRNISTALMYSFGNRMDFAIVDEPLFGYFLDYTGAWRPSRDEVLKIMEKDPKKFAGPDVDILINKLDTKLLDEEAVSKVMNIVPVYSRIPRILEKMRGLPIVGSFTAFPAENLRMKYRKES